MQTIKIIVGPIATNCYIVVDSRQAVIIDPGDEPEKILEVIEKNNLRPKYILLTHDHFDHVGALDSLEKKFGLKHFSPKGGDEFKIGETILKTTETPGHTKDGVCFVCEKEKIIFSGDTLFYHSIGRTDLEGGDYNKIQKSLEKILAYPDDFKIYPGHGPETTIGEERHKNPFVA